MTDSARACRGRSGTSETWPDVTLCGSLGGEMGDLNLEHSPWLESMLPCTLVTFDELLLVWPLDVPPAVAEALL